MDEAGGDVEMISEEDRVMVSVADEAERKLAGKIAVVDVEKDEGLEVAEEVPSHDAAPLPETRPTEFRFRFRRRNCPKRSFGFGFGYDHEAKAEFRFRPKLNSGRPKLAYSRQTS